MSDPFIEIRGEFSRDQIEIMDAYCQANPGKSRVAILRELLDVWCKQRVHEATLVMRVAGRNGSGSESRRSRAAKTDGDLFA